MIRTLRDVALAPGFAVIWGVTTGGPVGIVTAAVGVLAGFAAHRGRGRTTTSATPAGVADPLSQGRG